MDQSHLRQLAQLELERHSRRVFLGRMGGAAFAATGSAAVLAACGSGSSTKATADTGTVGGNLNFLGVDGEDGAKVAKPFLDKNNVKLKAAYVAGNDEMLTKLRTGGTSTFDVLTISKDYYEREVKLGYVRPFDEARLENFDGLFEGFKTAPWVKIDGKTRAFPLIWGSEPCVYDPAKWGGVPPRYTDFADKKYKGALTTIDEPYGNQWLVAKSLNYGENGQYNRLTQKQLDGVRDAWIEIKKNVVAMTTAFGDQTDLLVRKEASMALNSWQAVVDFARPKGVKLAYASPAIDDTYYWSDSYYIPSQAPNAATAYAYINYMTSPESNAKLANTLQSGCTVAGAVDLLPSDSLSKKYEYDIVKNKLEGNFIKTIVPPEKAEGDIVGTDAWVKSWQQVKAS